jgi:hypothetical protein
VGDIDLKYLCLGKACLRPAVEGSAMQVFMHAELPALSAALFPEEEGIACLAL